MAIARIAKDGDVMYIFYNWEKASYLAIQDEARLKQHFLAAELKIGYDEGAEHYFPIAMTDAAAATSKDFVISDNDREYQNIFQT